MVTYNRNTTVRRPTPSRRWLTGIPILNSDSGPRADTRRPVFARFRHSFGPRAFQRSPEVSGPRKRPVLTLTGMQRSYMLFLNRSCSALLLSPIRPVAKICRALLRSRLIKVENAEPTMMTAHYNETFPLDVKVCDDYIAGRKSSYREHCHIFWNLAIELDREHAIFGRGFSQNDLAWRHSVTLRVGIGRAGAGQATRQRVAGLPGDARLQPRPASIVSKSSMRRVARRRCCESFNKRDWEFS